MTEKQDEKESMPNRFTGKWRGQYFYKGQRWAGPTNRIGVKPLIAVEIEGSKWGVRTKEG
jgi:hypothetical protein